LKQKIKERFKKEASHDRDTVFFPMISRQGREVREQEFETQTIIVFQESMSVSERRHIPLGTIPLLLISCPIRGIPQKL
jgi:hypothetical protein